LEEKTKKEKLNSIYGYYVRTFTQNPQE